MTTLIRSGTISTEEYFRRHLISRPLTLPRACSVETFGRRRDEQPSLLACHSTLMWPSLATNRTFASLLPEPELPEPEPLTRCVRTVERGSFFAYCGIPARERKGRVPAMGKRMRCSTCGLRKVHAALNPAALRRGAHVGAANPSRRCDESRSRLRPHSGLMNLTNC